MPNEIKVTFPGGKRVNAFYKGFEIMTDQPAYAGGEGTAPAPFDLFLASIATCAGFYVLSFCQSRKIPTDNVALEMRTEKKPEAKLITKVILEIQLPQGFPQKYEDAVIKSVQSCSVKTHILKAPDFEIKTTAKK